MAEQQTFSNHRRFDPPYHFFALPVLLLVVLATAYHLVRTPNLRQATLALLAIIGALVAFKVRLYALRVQDRIIRLEETLRMQALLPADLQGRIRDLSPGQMVGLRFASDVELADRVREALDQNLGGEAIKKRIQTWRPDTFRV
jgi:hypothetical protein